MPRRNRPRRTPDQRGDISRMFGGGSRVESYNGEQWEVREVRGNDQGRTFTCPGCQQQLSSAVAHVVAWPAEGLGDVTDRRHWHTACWAARERRTPRGSWR